MKILLWLVALVAVPHSFATPPLTEAEAIQRVQSLPEFAVYAKDHPCAFDDNEWITEQKRVSSPVRVPVWRIDVHTIVRDPAAEHLALWNRFYHLGGLVNTLLLISSNRGFDIRPWKRAKLR